MKSGFFVQALNSQAPEITLILVDNGDIESQTKNAITAASFFPAINHLRLPIETTWAEKLVNASTDISTPYLAFCPDDDIPVIGGIIDAVSMLSSDSRMVCAQGYALSLTEIDSAMLFGPVEDYVPSYDDEVKLKRLFSMMRRYQPSLFAFYRTEILGWVAREFAAAKIQNLNLMFQEFFCAALVCSRGTIGRTASIYLWRRVTGSHTDRRMIHPFHQLIDNPGLLGANYQEFREKLIPYYKEDACLASIDVEFGVRRFIDLVFTQFLFRHIDYGELDGKIRELVNDIDKDYFASLPAQEQNLDPKNYLQILDIGDIHTELWINESLFMLASQVSEDLSTGELNQDRELRISIDMLIDAIKSALEYSSSR